MPQPIRGGGIIIITETHIRHTLSTLKLNLRRLRIANFENYFIYAKML